MMPSKHVIMLMWDEQMNALKIIQHLRIIKLWELFYICLQEPSDNNEFNEIWLH